MQIKSNEYSMTLQRASNVVATAAAAVEAASGKLKALIVETIDCSQVVTDSEQSYAEAMEATRLASTAQQLALEAERKQLAMPQRCPQRSSAIFWQALNLRGVRLPGHETPSRLQWLMPMPDKLPSRRPKRQLGQPVLLPCMLECLLVTMVWKARNLH